jgi:histidyl-tRNA synthetase
LTEALQAVRGMNDILPEQTPYWQQIESICRDLSARYGYREIRFPIMEQTALFSRGIGDATDIVEKEMYTFTDRNGDSLSLRPEGTASCVRAGIQHSLFYNQIQRLWYLGPMFRHERPQKGRYRQFHHYGIEAYGMAGPDIDAEIILLSRRLLAQLGLEDQVELQLNCLGTTAARAAYRERLVAFYQQHYDVLDEDSRRRLVTNPLRILDSKNPLIVELNRNAPILLDHLDPASQQHFDGLRRLLDAAEVQYSLNPRLVRGLDYYELTVFEWVTTALGAQGTVCAGGRYNRLVEELGGRPTPAIGFACGLERLVLLLTAADTAAKEHADVYLALIGDPAVERGILLAETLRSALPALKVLAHCGGGSLKSQLKSADKSGAFAALIIGENELAAQQAIIKILKTGEQQMVPLSAVIDFFKNRAGELSHAL